MALVTKSGLSDISLKLKPKPDRWDESKTVEATKNAMMEMLAKRNPEMKTKASEPQFIKYTPAQQNPDKEDGAVKTRLIKMVETPVDPLLPPSHKLMRAPRGPPSPPAPVMQSTPRALTEEQKKEWTIPPVVSSWKNPKGMVIPLDKRIGADGRRLITSETNDKFAKFATALGIAEQTAREEIERRSSLQRRLGEQERKRKEEELSRKAEEARLAAGSMSRERESMLRERRVIREHEERVGDRKRVARDLSEKIALGTHTARRSEESVYDSRLFNQEKGVDAGFGFDDEYSVYDKALSETAGKQKQYKPSKDIIDESAPDKLDGDDPFGLESFMDEARK